MFFTMKASHAPGVNTSLHGCKMRRAEVSLGCHRCSALDSLLLMGGYRGSRRDWSRGSQGWIQEWMGTVSVKGFQLSTYQTENKGKKNSLQWRSHLSARKIREMIKTMGVSWHPRKCVVKWRERIFLASRCSLGKISCSKRWSRIHRGSRGAHISTQSTIGPTIRGCQPDTQERITGIHTSHNSLDEERKDPHVMKT